MLVNSIREYKFIARRMMLDEVRRDVGRTAVALEHDLQRAAREGNADFPAALQRHFEENGSRGWLLLRSKEGRTLAKVGMDVSSTFDKAEVEASLRDHDPLFRTRQSAAGEALVELFVLHIRPPHPGQPPLHRGEPPQRMGQPSPPLLEVGIPLSEIRAQFWPLRRSLIIDLSAAIALITSVVLVSFRYRAFDRARQLEQQLEIARQVQQALLRSTRNITDCVQLAAECVPAWHVGGDFYDIYPVGRGVALLLGDVSGKGVPAALLAGVVQGAIRVRDWHSSPASHEEAARDLNELLLERASGDRYTTLFWCYYDQLAQRLYYINAGHCPPLLVRRNSSIVALDEGGTVLGLIPGATYRQASVPIEPGDLLIIFSDGVVEAANEREEEFGEHRLGQILQQNFDQDVDNLRERITGNVKEFTGATPLADDLTFLLARFEGVPAKLREATETETALRV
jgi:serine phosphatase RsbU (regulator of sigma subunit)